MHAVVRIYADRACAVDDVVRAGRLYAAALERGRGFDSCFVIRAQNGRLLLVTLFDAEVDLQRDECLSGACFGDSMLAVGEPAEVLQGDVVFQRGL